MASTNEQTGGPALSVTNLAEALASRDISSHLFALDYQLLGKRPRLTQVKEHIWPATFIARHFRGREPRAARGLAELAAGQFDLIHNHGMWMFPNLYARLAATRANIPLVTSPRGMLDSWSLNRSRLKKQIVWLLQEHRNLKAVTVFHATSSNEAAAIRRLGFTQPIAVIGNGVSIPSRQDGAATDLIMDAYPRLAGKKRLLFMSRIHPKKGLPALIQAWRRLAPAFPDWQLIIAGPDITGYRPGLERIVSSLGLKESVLFTGALQGAVKESMLSHADLFVLPSHSENFANVIAEALAHGLAVVTTTATPWSDLLEEECGWWVEPTPEAIRAALGQAMNLPDSVRGEMGARGRNLVERKYSWDRVAADMASVYNWILSGGSKPECVELCGPRTPVAR